METSKKLSRTTIRLYAIKRLYMWHFLSGRLPLFLVSEFPKSGGTWFSQMVADYLELPFPRNSIKPTLQRSVLHGHHLYNKRFQNVCYVLRDGRDIMVSAYYHWLFDHEWNNSGFVESNRKKLGFRDINDIQTNLPRFIEYMFTQFNHGPTHFSWSEFVRSWVERPVPMVKYEDLLTIPEASLAGVIERLTGQEPDYSRVAQVVKQNSFAAKTKREPGKENKNSFLRKGIAGDWKNHFTLEARQCFDKFAGAELMMCGYEPSHDWVYDTVVITEPAFSPSFSTQ